MTICSTYYLSEIPPWPLLSGKERNFDPLTNLSNSIILSFWGSTPRNENKVLTLEQTRNSYTKYQFYQGIRKLNQEPPIPNIPKGYFPFKRINSNKSRMLITKINLIHLIIMIWRIKNNTIQPKSHVWFWEKCRERISTKSQFKSELRNTCN